MLTTMAAISGYHYAPLHYSTYPADSRSSFHRAPATFYTMGDFGQQPQQTLSRLAQSRSKADFFKHLGWDEKNESHKRLYSLMKEEAANARKTLTNDRSNLNSTDANDRNIQPPYSSSQMTETALFHEVNKIWDAAGPETKSIYDRGGFVESGQRDNWIIRWVLWHVFRYRDVRNRNRNQPGRVDRASSASSAGSPTSPSGYPSASRIVFDPVRDAHMSNGNSF